MPTASQFLRCFPSCLLNLARDTILLLLRQERKVFRLPVHLTRKVRCTMDIVRWLTCAAPEVRSTLAEVGEIWSSYYRISANNTPHCSRTPVCCSFVGPLLARVRTQLTPTLFTSVLSFVKTV